MKKLHSIQALRAVAAILIMLRHLIDMGRTEGLSFVGDDLFFWGNFRVPIFFLLSGFIITYVFADKQINVRKFLFARFARIYVVYWIFAVPLLILWAFYPTPFGTNITLAQSLFLLPSRQDGLAGNFILGNAWTLFYLLWFYVVFAILQTWNSRLLMAIGLASYSVVIVLNQYYFFHISGLIDSMLDVRMLYIFLGVGVAKIIRDEKGVDIVIGTFLFSLILSIFNPIDVFIATAIPIGFILLEKSGYFKCPKIVSTLGDASYVIYLAHIPAAIASSIVWRYLGLGEYIGTWLIVTILGVLIFSVLFNIFIEKRIFNKA